MSAKILVVEDEENIRVLIQYNLEKAGFVVCAAVDGTEALISIEEEQPDLVLLDWMLPGGASGLEVCRQIRSKPHTHTRTLPVIMITARGEEDDRVRGLEIGADDYLTKPFSVGELIARIKAVLRRARPAVAGDVVSFGDIILDRETMRVRRAGREIRLGPTEFRLLDCFLRRPGRVLSRESLLDLVWGREVYVEPRTVDVHVGRLRKALNEKDEVDPIRTVRAAGYALNETYEAAANAASDANPDRSGV